jgi:hypothetical protein
MTKHFFAQSHFIFVYYWFLDNVRINLGAQEELKKLSELGSSDFSFIFSSLSR